MNQSINTKELIKSILLFFVLSLLTIPTTFILMILLYNLFPSLAQEVSEFGPQENLYSYIILFLPAIATFIIGLIYLLIRKRSEFININLNNILKGSVLGLGAILICILIDLVINNSKIRFIGVNRTHLFLFLLFFIQSTGEEILSRSVLYDYTKKASNKVIAVIINCLIFALFHIGNDGFNIIPAINLMILSVIFCFLYEKIGLEGVSFFHTFWNFAQSALFSLPVSGQKVGIGITELYNSNLAISFGLEGSVICTGVLLIFLVALITFSKRLNTSRKVNMVEGKLYE